MEIQGKIISVLPPQSGSSARGSWEKHSFVVSWTEGQYEQKLCLEVMGSDKWEKMEKAVVVGNEVLVKFNVTSREYQGRWFTSASCYYCASVGGQQQSVRDAGQSPAPDIRSVIPDTPSQQDVHVNDSGLPF